MARTSFNPITLRESLRIARLMRMGLIALGLIGALMSSCAAPRSYAIASASHTMLQTNLRVDGRRVAWSVGYIAPPGGSVLPMCTPVRINQINRREIRFTDLRTNVAYRYALHRSARRTSIDDHVQRYFGEGCPDVSVLSDADQAGIRDGEIYQGMSKEGVLRAWGYPPRHATPTLNGDRWTYWRNRINRVAVQFEDGVVSSLQD